MTPKEALNIIWHDSYELKVEAYHVLQLLVDKATPIKPYIDDDYYFACSVCHGTIIGVDDYCSECGQKLDWSDE